jgi:hypothetical protein
LLRAPPRVSLSLCCRRPAFAPPAACLSRRLAGLASVARSRAVRLTLVLRSSGACPGCALPGSAMCVCVRGAVVRELGLGLAWSRRHAAEIREARGFGAAQIE